MSRPLFEIAKDISQEWGEKVNYAAVPYLKAMHEIDSIDSNYGFDSARSIVQYFLANAGTFRGPVARTLKAELKALS